MKDLNLEIRKIISKIDPTWSDLEKTRFVYLEVGKLVEKNAEFFLTQSAKLQKNALSDAEMSKIYDSAKNIFKYPEWERIICRSGAVIIKNILDELNISCRLMRTVGYSDLTPTSKKRVHHYFLCVDIDDKHYFLNITADLHNIKNGFATEHFACDVPYIDDTGNQVYEGEKIDNTLLNQHDLNEIDKKIGYIDTSYVLGKNTNYLDYGNRLLDYMKNMLSSNTWYYEIMAQKTKMYHKMYEIIDGNGEKSSITSLDNKTIFTQYHDQLIKNVCLEIEKFLNSKISPFLPARKFIDFETWLRHMCDTLYFDLINTYGQENADLFMIDDDFDYKKWRKLQRERLEPLSDDKKDVLKLLDQVNSYVKTILALHDEYSQDERTTDIAKKAKNMRSLHTIISEHFLADDVILERNIIDLNGQKYIKSNYINEKFKTMFPIVFNANWEKNPFNELGYSEQIATINKIIPYIFGEVREDNCEVAPGYTRTCKAILNRIRLYTLLNQKTGNYEIIFHIPSFFDFEDEFYYRYQLTENTFTQIDIIEDIYNNKQYEIISGTLKRKMENFRRRKRKTIEEVEQIERRRR